MINEVSQLARQKVAMLYCVYALYLSCVGAKNTVQSLFRYVGRCCKEALLPSKAL